MRSFISQLIIYLIFLSFLSACTACGPTAPPDKLANLELVADPQNGGTVEGGGSYRFGTRITIRAIPSPAFYLSGWYIDDNLRVLSVSM